MVEILNILTGMLVESCCQLQTNLQFMCVCVVWSGAFTREVHVAASKDLNFDELIPLNPFK